MNELQIFNSEEFGEIRTVNINGEPWLAGKDVAVALGYTNPQKAIRDHVLNEDRTVNESFTVNGTKVILINESGLYALIFGSKLESAQRFKRWVTNEVLPTIRKTGGYQKPLTQQEMMRIQLGMIDDHESRIENLENNMTIDYGQQMILQDAVNKTVVECLGGKGSEAYREISKKVFAECNRDLKHRFQVNDRNNVPKLRFEEAVEYAKNWRPCTNTQIMIKDCNAQVRMQ